MIDTLINTFFQVLYTILKKDKTKVVFHSFPDVSDNSFAFFVYLTKKYNYKTIWLVDTTDKKNVYLQLISNYCNCDNVTFVKKKSILGLYHFLTASSVYVTHGLFSFLKKPLKGHKVVNLWHGMPIKRIGYLDAQKIEHPITYNYFVVTSSFYQDIMSKAFNLDKKNILISGLPRNDFLFNSTRSFKEFLDYDENIKKTILWMPTYRNAVVGVYRTDGDPAEANTLFNSENLLLLNQKLKEIQAFCVIKLHPMDKQKPGDFDKYSNISILDNSFFENNKVELYSFLANTDALFTDFSSIYIDYLLLNKPIGFVMPDIESYKNSRGLIFENPEEYLPGEVIKTLPQILKFIEDVLVSNNDNYALKRKKTKQLFHKNNANFSKILDKKINELD